MVRTRSHPPRSFLWEPGSDERFRENLRATFDLPASEGKSVPPPAALHTDLLRGLLRAGPPGLFSHQAKGIESLLAGRDIMVSTPTASGKSLIYQLYALDAWLKDPSKRFLFTYPFKALAQDQCAKINAFAQALGVPGFRAEVYDGDTGQKRRKELQKEPPPVLITNPDMLHLAFLAYRENWEGWFRSLALVVLDEAHVYRGIFGANVHHLLWRLGRVLALAGSDARWVATSATLSDAGGFFRTLTGREAVALEESGAPRPPRRLHLLSTEGSPYTLAVDVMDRLLREDRRTLTFTKARRITELLYSWLCRRERSYRKSVSSYRAGFLPSERRRIEAAFFDGSLRGVVSTSAMEVGIDVGGLDACVLVGYPGSLVSLFQRMGRAGRGTGEAAVFLIAMPDALDQYFVQHPDRLLDRPLEEAVLDPENPLLLPPHLLCAAREAPLRESEFPAGSLRRRVLEELGEAGDLVLDAEGTSWHTLRRAPHRDLSLRGIGESYRIVDPSGKAIGTVDGVRVHRECHEGAVYLHQGLTYEVQALSHKDLKVVARAAPVDHYTEARGDKETEILEVLERRRMGPVELCLGRLKVTEHLTSFVKKSLSGGEVLSEHPLEAPPIVFETEGVWVALPPGSEAEAASRGLHFMGGIHAYEHALIGIFPLKALSDRWDLGGISYPLHPQVAAPAVFVYDGYPGGVGLSRKGYAVYEDLLDATARLLEDCPCETGCPGCIQSPKCGSGNKPLDKEAARLVCSILLGKVVPEADAQKSSSPTEAAAPAPAPAPRRASPPPGRLVFDLETQRLAAEVGGWGHISAMRLALAVTWDLDRDRWRTYFEEEAGELVDDLLASPLVVGFNVDGFDLAVLQPYTDRDLKKVRTLDLLKILRKRMGFRVSLASLGEANFEEGKSADGVQSVAWFKEGRFDRIEAYCKQDVALTGRIFLKGLEEGFVLVRERAGGLLRIPVNGWGLPHP